jgi:hypothetical protein
MERFHPDLGADEYLKQANDAILTMVQIETKVSVIGFVFIFQDISREASTTYTALIVQTNLKD